jgi:hypothetical protein
MLKLPLTIIPNMIGPIECTWSYPFLKLSSKKRSIVSNHPKIPRISRVKMVIRSL